MFRTLNRRNIHHQLAKTWTTVSLLFGTQVQILTKSLIILSTYMKN